MRTTNISKQRIMAQAKKLSTQKLPYLRAQPLPDDLYTWHFTIQGPQNTEFHQGIYHGQILLPYQYPFKPPDIVFMNKNGRFQTNTKICLTITQYHPEEWNSAWTIRTMLEAVVSLFSQNVQGVGALTATPDVRRFLAKSSHSFTCEKCGLIRDHLAPRGKPEEKSSIDKELKVQEEIMQRKMSQADPASQQLPTVQRLYSEDISNFKYRQAPKSKRPEAPSSTIKNDRIQEQKEEQKQKRTGPQLIYIKELNPFGQGIQKIRKTMQKITHNTTLLDRITKSMKWV